MSSIVLLFLLCFFLWLLCFFFFISFLSLLVSLYQSFIRSFVRFKEHTTIQSLLLLLLLQLYFLFRCCLLFRLFSLADSDRKFLMCHCYLVFCYVLNNTNKQTTINVLLESCQEVNCLLVNVVDIMVIGD